MRTHARLLVVSGGMLAVAVWCWASAGSGSAADENPARADIVKLADAIQSGDAAAKQTEMDALKEADLEMDIMPVFSLRTPKGKGGLGIGAKPGTVTPDGIEKKIEDMGKRALSKATLTKQAPDLQKAAYIAAAVGALIPNKCPDEKKQKGEQDWKTWSADMEKGALALAKALDTGDPAMVQKAADTLDASCKNCHNVFKD